MSQRATELSGSGMYPAFGASSAFGSSLGAGSTSPLSYLSEPLDLSTISDPFLVVTFKNLQKKDENTKVKALEELSRAIEASPDTELEEGVIAAWIQSYPRLSVDLSRRVRQLTHNVHATVCSNSKKRVAKYMPQVIGPWLAGTYDNDSIVVKAARAAFSQVFTADKLKKVWEVYHSAILDYCINIIENEQVYTLSDERQTSEDDAEAKFARVIGACISTIRHLLNDVPPEQIAKENEVYMEFFSNRQFWKFGHHADPYLRKSVYKLVRTCLSKYKGYMEPNLEYLAQHIIVESSSIPQTGSIIDYVDTLILLTETYPHVWAAAVAGKKKKRTPTSMLRKFISQGSQGAQSDFWVKLNELIDIVPADIIPSEQQAVEEFLDYYVRGVNGPQEPRANAVMSWTSYFGVCQRILSLPQLPEDTKQFIIESRIIPLYEEYLKQEGKSELRVQGDLAKTICINGLLKLSPEKNVAIVERNHKGENVEVFRPIFDKLWVKLEDLVFSEIKTNKQSPDKPGELPAANRWLELIAELYNVLPREGHSFEKLKASNQALIKTSLEIIEASKGKVSSIASLFEKALALSPPDIWNNVDLYSAVEDLFSVQLPNLYPSPSVSQVFTAMLHWFKFTRTRETIEALWTLNIGALLSAPEDAKVENLLVIFQGASNNLRGKVPMIPALTQYVTDKCQQAVDNNADGAWAFVIAALKTQGILLPTNLSTLVIEQISSQISSVRPEDAENSPLLSKLEYMANNHLHWLVEFVATSKGGELLLHLLKLEGLTLEISPNIVTCINQAIFRKGVEMPESREDAHNLIMSMSKLIPDAAKNYKEARLPIGFLSSKALLFFGQASGEERISLVNALKFDDDEWPMHPTGRLPINPFFEIPPEPSVDLTNPLSGCVYLIEGDKIEAEQCSPNDDLGFGEVLHMAFYTLKLLQDPVFHESLDRSHRTPMLAKVLVVAEIAKDHLNSPWMTHLKLQAEATQFISDVQSFAAQRLAPGKGFFDKNGHCDIDRLGKLLTEWSKGRSTFAFYCARVLYWFLSELVELHGCSQKTAETFIGDVPVRDGADTFLVVAFILGLSRPLFESKVAEKLRNALASDISGISADEVNSGRAKGSCPPKLVILNALMQNSLVEEPPLTQQRAMFLLRNVLTWFDLGDEEEGKGQKDGLNEALVAETAKLLRALVPITKEVYGSHWKSLYQFVLMGLKGSSSMSPMTYWCLKLYETLKANYGGNDDFEEAFTESEDTFNETLIRRFESAVDDIGDQAEEICYELLCRQIKRIPFSKFTSMDGIYPLLHSMSKPVQETAFDILHQYIPSQQEQITIEAALARDEDELQVSLAPELLSLILETPTARKIEDIIHEEAGAVERSVRGYFLAWRLIFDHFDKATFRVKSAYTSELQTGGYLDSLLTLIFTFLGITQGRIYEPNRDLITDYPISEEDWTSEKSIKQLLIHLYYLSLRYTPSLAKSWWQGQKTRQLVENITEKYISPLIIDYELSNVSKWASEASDRATSSSPSAQLQVKIAKSVREVTATYPVDDMQLELVVRLPTCFPLLHPTIEGLKKIGFTDTQWKSIKLSSQAVISLQGGSVVDALLLFEKNVELHFQGVEECAICYSIVGQERTVPGKSCVTCKKRFHGGCLYKWFRTSNSNSCPLCRTGWQFYGGIAH